MASRKRLHKSHCNNPTDKAHNTKVYRTIRENGGWQNWNMVCIEVMENTTKLEAEIREEHWRMELKASLNDKMVTRGYMTREEYKKQYYEVNKDHFKEQFKQHYEANKDYYIEYNKQYRKEHKEQIRELRTEKHDCICGGRFTIQHKARHSRSIKHQQYLDTLGKSI
jgi:hypothetical protein